MIYYLRQIIVDPLIRFLKSVVSSPRRLFSARSRPPGLSQPARVTLVVSVLLLGLLLVSLWTFSGTAGRPGWIHKFNSLILPLILLPVILWFVYRAVELWMQGDVSPFPDVDWAWRTGMAALANEGLDISRVPVYLVVGGGSSRGGGIDQIETLMEAANLQLSVRNVPAEPSPFKGPPALTWYARQDAIYIVCTQVGRLAGLLTRLQSRGQGAPFDPRQTADPGEWEGTRTMVIGAAGGPQESKPLPGAAEPTADGRRTMQPNLTGTQKLGDAAHRPMEQRTGRETMVVGDRGADQGSETAPPPSSGPTVRLPSPGPGAPAASPPVQLAVDDMEKQTGKLEYLCQLLRRTRQPVAPMNGTLLVLPFDVLDGRAVPKDTEYGLAEAIRDDLTTIRRASRLRAAVTALITCMERVEAFFELVKRIGPKEAQANRFGKGVGDTLNVPDPEKSKPQVEAVVESACGAFEQWAYALFGRPGGLGKVGNARLYELVCRVRGAVTKRLQTILAEPFAYDGPPKDSPAAKPPFFGGCYFAATGSGKDRRAFVSSVFDKVREMGNTIEWTDEALIEDRFYRRLTQIAWFVAFALVIAIGGLAYLLWTA